MGDFSDVVLESVVTEGEIVTIYDIKLTPPVLHVQRSSSGPSPGGSPDVDTTHNTNRGPVSVR